jgi:hypothetical protein
MFLPISSNSGLTRANAPRAAHHDGQAGGLGAHFAARHRGVQVVATQSVDFGAKSLVAMGEMELMSTTVLPGVRPDGDAVATKQHLLDIGRVGQHQ